MSKRTPSLDWQFAESEADWERRCVLPGPDISPADSYCQRQQRILWRIAALFLLLASANGGREYTDQATLPILAATAQSALEAGAPDNNSLVADVTAELTVTKEWHQGMQK